MLKLFADAYPAAYRTLYEAKPITCSVTSTTYDAVPAPCAVILDVSLPTVMPTSHDGSFIFASSSVPFLNCKLLEPLADLLYRSLLSEQAGPRRTYVILVQNLWEAQEILVQKLMQRLLVLGCPLMRLVLRYISESYHDFRRTK